MKPDGASATDMEESEVEPSELFCDLGLVVVESRLPHQSPKGRIEGPHCPAFVGHTTKHVCSPTTQSQCRSYEAVEREMQLLWRNRIPMCIEVLLLPDCHHGHQRALSMDTSFPSLKDGCMLLEQWIVHVLPKRCVEHLTSPRTLFQAVKSYLHFSQLSAWLNLSQGTAPKNVAYRISPPGEFCTSNFTRPPECHTFPVCGVGRSTMVKVMVRALPRLRGIPRVPCTEEDEEEEEEGRMTGAVGLDRAAVWASALPLRGSPGLSLPRAETRQPQSIHHYPKTACKPQQHQQQHQQRTVSDTQDEVLRPSSDEDRAMQRTLGLPHRESPSPTHDLHHPQRKARQDRPNTSFQKSCEFGAIPKRKAHRSPPPDYFDHHAMSAPELDSLTHAEEEKQKPVNTKVIASKKWTGHLPVEQDGMWGSPSYSSVINKDSTDSDTSSPDIDKLLNKTLGSKPEPMTPEEMEDYLSRLCISRNTRTKQPSPTEQLTWAEQKAWRLTSTGDGKISHAKLSPDLCLSTNNQLVNNKDLSSDSNILSLHKLKLSSEESPRVISLKKAETPPDQPAKVQCRQCQQQQQTQTPKRALSPKSWLSHKLQGQQEQDKVKFSIGPRDEDDDTSKLYLQDELDSEPKSVQNGHGPALATVPKESPEIYAQDASSPTKKQLPDAADQQLTTGSTKNRPALHKSISSPSPLSPSRSLATPAPGPNRASSLLKSVMRRDLAQQFENQSSATGMGRPIPTSGEQANFQRNLRNSTSMIFHPKTGLPLQSSPAPMKKRTASASFEYDISLTSARAIKNSLSCVNLDKQNANEEDCENTRDNKFYSTSAPASTNSLLVNFEESMLNGRLEPTGVVDGFTADLGASGSFCPKHATLPVTAFFFKLSDDNAPSPYLGHINLESLGKRGYHVPKKGTVQVTLFNPNKAVVKMFVVMYDMSDMPANCQTFLRQRTLYMPVKGSPSDVPDAPVFLRYLIHLRFSSSKSGKIYLHTDIRLIFARDKVEYDSRVANYELRSFTEGPSNPHFSPKR